MKARDVMTAHPSVITPDEPIHRAAELMRDRRVGMLPVIDNLSTRRLQGVLTDRDIVVRCVASGRGLDAAVREHMTARHLTTVRLDDQVRDVAHKMRRDHVRRVPVLSDDDKVVGVVAIVDLATRLRPADPELVEGLERDAAAPASG
jgi:CBS domain-containing protein